MPNYKQKAKEVRIKVLDLIFNAQTSHIGSCFSAIDIMAVLFEKADPQKDEVVLSAGWKAAAWYYFLQQKGIISEEELNSFCQEGSKFIGLVEPIDNRWGLRIGGGSMGLGLPAAVGIALAKKIKKEEGNVYVLMSDGELQCGTTWESALIATQHKLNNLIVFVDNNGLQAMGEIDKILSLESIMDKFISFGWKVLGGDGHDFDVLENVWKVDWENPYSTDGIGIKEHGYIKGKPLLMICDTIKGKGVSFMENNNLYHYKAPSREEYEEALKELNG